MTIFDYLNDIVVHKKGTLSLEAYVPFLINRWLSFIAPEICLPINQFNQKVLLEDKQLHYKTMITLFPKMKRLPKITYIKKIQEKIQEQTPKIKAFAYNKEISEREALWLLRECPANGF